MESDLFGVVAIGLGVAALLYATGHAGRKLGLAFAPWLLPAGVGVAMLAYAIWSDYTWFERTKARLPPSAEILLIGEESHFWAPWSYLFAPKVRFAALDRAQVQLQHHGMYRGIILLVERHKPSLLVNQEFDCHAGRIRQPQKQWHAAKDDQAFQLICQPDRPQG